MARCYSPARPLVSKPRLWRSGYHVNANALGGLPRLGYPWTRAKPWCILLPERGDDTATRP